MDATFLKGGLLALVATWMLPPPAPAQVVGEGAAAQPYYYGGYSGYPSYYGGGYRSSTAVEGYGRGLGEVIRSYGDANLANARAQREWEAARAAYIENRTRAVQAYWERRDLYEQQQAEEAYEAAQEREERFDRILLKDLTPEEFNPTTGAVRWPVVLRDPEYREFREALNAAFAKRAEYGELASGEYLQAQQLIREWRQAVSQRRGRYAEDAFRQALRFLLKLNREFEHNLG